MFAFLLIATEDRPELAVAVAPLLSARMAIAQQIADLDRKVMKLARNNAQVQQLQSQGCGCPKNCRHSAPDVD
jgi:hypothetical protein